MEPTTQQRRQHSIAQKLADSELRTARLRTEQRKLENGQKIIIGGAMLAEIAQDDSLLKLCVALLEKRVTREADLRRIRPLLAELKSKQTAV